MGKVTTAVAALVTAVTDGVKKVTNGAGDKVAGPPSDPLTAATGDLRSAAKWLLGSFAAVGTLFAAGVQLTGAGNLSTDMPSRLLAALAGFTLVVVGVVLAIAATTKVMRRDFVTLDDILTEDHLKALDSNDALVEPFDSVTKLRERLNELRPKVREAETAVGAAKAAKDRLGPDADATQKEVVESAFRVAKADLLELQRAYGIAGGARARALSTGAFFDVRHRFEEASTSVIAGAVLTAVGLLSFVWGANPPDPGDLPTAVVLPQTPSQVKFLLTNAGREKYRTTLGGSSCNVDVVLEGIAMSVSGQEYKVASKQTAGCTSAWLVLSPDLARVAPAEDAEKVASLSPATKTPTTTATAQTVTVTVTTK